MTPSEFLAAQRERSAVLAALSHMECRQCHQPYNAHKMDCSYRNLDHDLRCPDCALKLIRTADAPASHEAYGEKAEWMNPRWACACGVRLTGEPEDNSRELAMERMYQRVLTKLRTAALELILTVTTVDGQLRPQINVHRAIAQAQDLYKLLKP